MKRYVLKLRKLKMPRRTLTELTQKNRKNTLKVRYQKKKKIERAHESYKTSLAWSLVHEISGRKGSSGGRIRASCPKERIKLWKEHFEGLLGQPPVMDEDDDDDDDDDDDNDDDDDDE